MLVIVNEKNVQEAINKLCGIADGLSFMFGNDDEYVKAIEQVESLLRNGIEDQKQD